MSIHSNALKQACKNLNIELHEIDSSGTFVEVIKNNKKFHFVANHLPLNNGAVIRICNDKEHTYNLLKSKIQIPITKGYLDPVGPEPYSRYAIFKSQEEIVEDMLKHFEFPFIVKMNRGSQGKNVYKVESKEEVVETVKKIFTKESHNYDYVVLAQEYVKIDHEYRVIVLNGEIKLVYEKDNSQAEFTGNLSPLHWEGAKARLLKGNEFPISNIQSFIKPIFENLDLKFGGLDIAIDEAGKMWLFEINTTIGIDYFVTDNGIEEVVKLYEEIVKAL